MADGALEKLFFQISLIDKVTQPAKGVCAAVLRIQSGIRDTALQWSYGAGALGLAINQMAAFTNPAREMSKAIGEVASLGVTDKELKTLEKAAKNFAMDFGEDATAIVRSAYDIQSAIPGLGEGALAAFTTNSSLLAKATKSTADEMTSYMGTMYNIFEADAKKIGQAEWVEQLTGKTAKAVEMFKTTGPAMKQAFESFGSIGAVMNIKMEDQMAALGVLQGKMGAANAGTGLKSFYTKLGTAGTALNLDFTGDDGKLLPVYEIISKIEGKIGDLSETEKVSKLTAAFGETGAAAVMNMLGKTEQIKNSVASLAAIDGNNAAVNMAEKMVDPAQKFTEIIKVLKINLGQGLLPVVNMLLTAAGGVAKVVSWALQNIPGLNFLVAACAGVVMMTVGAFGALKIIGAVKTGIQTLITGFRILRVVLYQNHLLTLKQIAAWLWQKSVQTACAVANGLMTAALWLYNAAQIPAIVATWAFTAALLACPVTWIVLGIVALIAAIVALIVYWDEVTAFVYKYADAILAILGPIGWVVLAFKHWDTIKEIIGSIWDYIKEFFNWIGGVAGKIGNFFAKFFGGNNSVNIENIRNDQPVVEGGAVGRNKDIAAGGVRNTTNNSNTTNYGGVTINSSRALTPGELEEYMLLQS